MGRLSLLAKKVKTKMSLAQALQSVQPIRGWDWSPMRAHMGDLGWSYEEVLGVYLGSSARALDVGTGGGEVFSRVGRPQDVALDLSPEMLAVARRRLQCPLVRGDQSRLPFRPDSFDVVADRHVGVEPDQVVAVLRRGGVYVTQQVGGKTCQSIFDAFGWESNEEFWRRHDTLRGVKYWDNELRARFYDGAGFEVIRNDQVVVDYEFLDEESLAFWLTNAPLPDKPDPERHAQELASISLRTTWHAELLVVRRL
jgi:SAM-dependent methyltransferase